MSELKADDVRFHEGGGAKFWHDLYVREQAERIRLEQLIVRFVRSYEAHTDGGGEEWVGGGLSIAYPERSDGEVCS